MTWLVAVESAMALTVLVAATSLIRSVGELQRADPGIRTRGLISLRLPSAPGLPRPPAEYIDNVAARLRGMPGVLGVTFASQVPPETGPIRLQERIELQTGITSSDAVSRIAYNRVAPDFFEVTGVQLVYGTTFNDASVTNNEVIVSQATAHMLWGTRSPVGERFRFSAREPWQTVIGVAADVAAGSLAPESREQVLYMPLLDHRTAALLIRTDGRETLASQAGTMASQLASGFPAPTIRAVDDAIAQTIAGPAFTMRILAAFAQLCVLLTALGIYGVLTYAVEQRKPEIGIRLALGGTAQSIGWKVLAEAIHPAAAGMAAALVMTPWLRPLLQGIVEGADLMDWRATVIAVCVLCGAALVAAAVPAVRAMRMDPAAALRLD